MTENTTTRCARCGGSAIDPEDSHTGSYIDPPVLEPCRDCVHPSGTGENTTTYSVGDRVRILVDSPADACTPAMPVGSLGTVVEVYPGGAVGVDLDADPFHLAADYTLAEIAPAPTLQETVTDLVYAAMADVDRHPGRTAYRITSDVLEAVAPFLAADRTRILGVVAAWVHSASEFGGVGHGDLIRALEVHGYTLPGTTNDEETDR